MGRWLAAKRWMRQDLLRRSLCMCVCVCVLCKRRQELGWSLFWYEQGVGRYDICMCVVWALFDRVSFPFDNVLSADCFI